MISIEGLLLQLFGEMLRLESKSYNTIPSWIKIIENILNDSFNENVTLGILSKETGIHPVHISRMFPRYFGSTIGSYIRKVRVIKAIEYMFNTNHSLTQISSMCGFSDQSHFIRIFKLHQGITPSQYKRSINKR